MVSYNRGYEILKFFPAEVLGGIKMLKALQGPFPDCLFFQPVELTKIMQINI